MAQPPAAKDAAMAAQLFKEGKALFIQGDFQTACPKLEESYRLVADLGALLALATCREEQGNAQQAYSDFSRAEPLVHQEGRADRIALVTEHLARLRPLQHEPLQKEAAPPASALAPAQGLIAPPATPGHDSGRSADAAATAAADPSERGVFLQASFGAGYTFDTGGAVEPLVPWGALLVGGTLTPGLVLGGGVTVSESLTIGGPFLAHHLDGLDGWELQVLFGGAYMPDPDTTPFGVGAAVALGYDWRIAPEWGIGVLGRVSAAWTEYGLVAPALLMSVTNY